MSDSLGGGGDMKAKELAEMLLARPEADVLVRTGGGYRYSVERVDVPYIGPVTIRLGPLVGRWGHP